MNDGIQFRVWVVEVAANRLNIYPIPNWVVTVTSCFSCQVCTQQKRMSTSNWFKSKYIVSTAAISGIAFIMIKTLDYKLQKLRQLRSIRLAANAICNADYCLLSTGAGFSADSGLKVFKDIADIDVYKRQNLTYNDLSRPDNIEKRPLIAYGFWFWCYNTYKNAIPHNGYYIIKKWKDKYFNVNTDASKLLHKYVDNNSIGSFWCHTSNVDHLHEKAGFNPLEIDAIHGDMMYFQCSKRCCRKSWKLNENYTFDIDEKNILPLNKDYDKNIDNIEFKIPICKFCKKYPARPAIEMFGDFAFIGRHNRIDKWRNGVTKLCNQQHKKLVIIEIGAGIRIPSIRHHSEGLIQSLKNCTLIRCNPDFPEIPIRPNTIGKTISIKMKALQFIEAVDALLL